MLALAISVGVLHSQGDEGPKTLKKVPPARQPSINNQQDFMPPLS